MAAIAPSVAEAPYTILTDTHDPHRRKAGFLTDGVITAVVLVLVFAALDDITTDNATAFPMEYSILIISGGWLLYVIARLWRSGHRVLGTVSALALVVGVWAQRALVFDVMPGLWTEYVVLLVAYLWFWVLSGALLWLGRRQHYTGQGAIG
jgi:hypothetical protein